VPDGARGLAKTVTHHSPSAGARPLRTTPQYYRLAEAARNPHTVICEIFREYGDFVHWRGHQDICLMNHPELIRPILTRLHPHVSKKTFSYQVVRQVMGNGLVTSDGPDWGRQRKLVQPAFVSRRVARFDKPINAQASALVARWERQDPGEVLWIDREMRALILGVHGETLFGRDLSEHASEMAEILEIVNVPAHDPRALLTLNPQVSTPFTRKWKEAMKRLDDLVFGIIDERIRHGGENDVLLDRVLAAHGAGAHEGNGRRQLRDEVATLLLAGHETTAMALTWTLYLLATHPDIEERVVEHVEANLDGGPAAATDIARLPYLKQVVQEALRLYPPIWGFARRTERELELGGNVLPAETTLAVVTYALHRRPDFWPDPERFDPERFTPDQTRDRDFFAYLPFAAGPRNCVGGEMAMLEVQLILVAILRRFRMRVLPDHPVEPEPKLTLIPRNGIPVNLIPRRAVSARWSAAAPARPGR